jgi:hypothetical protein
MGEQHAKKICKMLDLARKTGAPVIAMCDSAGVRLDEGARAMNAYASIYAKMTQLSGVCPMIALVLGPVVGGAALIAQLADINKTSGAKEKMTSEQMRFTAKVMARKASHLKVTEAMLFLYRLRTQEYEKFYGAVDPDVIFSSLKTFERERADAYRRKERSDEQRKLLSSMSAPCSREEAVGTEEYMRGYNYAKEKEARLVRI